MRVFKEVLRHLRIFADDLTPQKRNLALGYGRNIFKKTERMRKFTTGVKIVFKQIFRP